MFWIVAAAMSREEGRTTKGPILVALAVASAVSASVFNATFEHQAASGVESMRHHFAYVRSDIRDLFGIKPDYVG